MNLTYPTIWYEGGAFHQNADKGRVFGKIIVASDSLCFEAQEFKTAMPLKGLLIKTGGANNRMIFFTHISLPDTSFFTSDHNILKDNNLISYSEITRQIGQIQKAKKSSQIAIIAAILLLLGFVYALFQLKEPITIAVAKRIPVSWEEKFGNAILNQITSEKNLVKDPEITDMLKQMTDPLLKQIPDKRYKFTVHIIKDPSINAFALPGGHIILNTGLILEASSSEEVIGVLAHEAAHVTLQHGLRQLIGSAGIFMLIQAFFGDASGLMAVILDKGAFLLTQKYSRDYEQEADEKGWSYLVHAHINPYGMISFFNMLIEKQEKGILKDIEDSLNILSTHPTTKDRIDYLQKKWEKESSDVSAYKVLFPEFKKFQDKIRNSG